MCIYTKYNDTSYRNALLKYFYYGKVIINLIFLLAVCIPIGINIHEFYEAVHSHNDTNNVKSPEMNQVSLY